MMQKLNFNNISIKNKILLIIFIISIITIFVSTYIYLLQIKNNFKHKTEQELEIISNIIAENLYAPLLFNDTTSAYKVLQTLHINPNIKKAIVFDENKTKLTELSFTASHCNINNLNFNKDSIIKTDSAFVIIKNIFDKAENNKLIGYLVIGRNINDYHQQLQRTILTNSIIAGIILIISFFIGFQLQKIVSRPIIKLSSIVQKITKSKDFSLRINKRGNDEIGILIEAFNEMLNTIENQNISLIKAKDDALRLAKAKQDFLANMSHEIRTPMNAIIGMIHLLQNTHLSKEQKEYLQHIDLSIQNLLVIINDILDISKIESGKIIFEKYRFNLLDTLDNIKKLFEAKAKEKELIFSVTKDNDVPLFWLGDQVRLNQILINLVGNAIKFTHEGYVSVNASVYNKINNHTYLILFTIKDTGIGIPEEVKNQIFESFTQASSDTTRKYGGTGLGLTIAKQLVELQNGKIWFESQLNVGTTFYFYLPLETTNPPTLEEIEQKANQSLSQKINLDLFKNSIILIVEDNPINLYLLKTLLKKQHFENLIFANNGKEALEILTKQKVDLILMDLHMPEMDGYEAATYIRNQLKLSTPIIALTAAVVQGEKEKCLSIGMNEYIAKPFNPNELFEKIIFLLNTKS